MTIDPQSALTHLKEDLKQVKKGYSVLSSRWNGKEVVIKPPISFMGKLKLFLNTFIWAQNPEQLKVKSLIHCLEKYRNFVEIELDSVPMCDMAVHEEETIKEGETSTVGDLYDLCKGVDAIAIPTLDEADKKKIALLKNFFKDIAENRGPGRDIIFGTGLFGGGIKWLDVDEK